MKVGSLFTGIGGIDLGLNRAGFEIVWQVEIDPYCQQLLGQHWPEVKRHRDIRACGAHNLEEVDLIAGGFPCTDISSAGKQAGIEKGKQSGLWREQARIIAEIRPRYVLIENVAALLYATKQRDGTRREAAIATVLRDLAERGYDACWRTCSAAEFGAPHLRKRVFIVAYLSGQRSGTRRAEPTRFIGQTNTHGSSTADVENSPGRGQQKRSDTTGLHAESDTSSPEMADANSNRQWQWAREPGPGTRCTATSNAGEDGERGNMADACGQGLEIGDRYTEKAQSWTTIDECGRHPREAESLLGGGAYGLPAWMDGIEQRWPAGPGQEQFAWEPPRVIQGKLKNRVARLKGLGNAVVPQIAEAIGYAIRRHAARQGLEAGK